jgi:hypothetical protein
MKICPYCAENIQNEAVKCRYCGEWLDGRAATTPASGQVAYYGYDYEYRSETELFGLPLVHIAYGINRETGRPRIARGIIAIGNIAFGLIALGGLACGGLSLGGLSLGIVTLGGVAVGGLALGGLSLGLLFSAGGMAVSGAYAIGGLALAPHYIGGNGIDPDFLPSLEKWLPWISSGL